ncbi:YhdP family protein [Halomonas rhizosphaerae]|uniref:AsmA-like C-terminal region-containing protein n=1 Tax=Halomonas rhizosphaerae TaxID=3043296 RepID=A0ABT6UUV6_9GAMM|nr:AsmA-like C-terminal region-containing protein [Halomonas rhizosphaerae]MDI5889739.1 AsmA-like C-terminal region-containing protein [Halomonas rhizosphaerae]
MSLTRLVARWLLTLVALLLALLAVLVLVLRLLPVLLETQAPRLERMLSARFNAVVELDELTAGLQRYDPHLAIDGLQIRSREGLGHVPLLEVEQAQLHLDSLGSLAAGVPLVADARVQGVTVHLYQDQAGRWHWPAPAELPPELVPETTFDLERLDFWVGMLLRQSAWVEEVSLVLHGRKERAVLKAPRLVMTGDARRTHLEGEVLVEGQREQAIRAVMELVPGPSGLRDFSAALQAEMRLDSLLGLSEVLGYGDALRLEAASGEARLWGRWHAGRLADLRLDVDAPLLALAQPESTDDEASSPAIVLNRVSARGQWLREASGWQAWLEGDARSADWARPEGNGDAAATGPAVPRYWHARSRDDGWWLNTSEFDLGALAAWRDRLPLPEALARVIDSLDPRGRVSGLGLGREGGDWVARASASEVAVSPWQQAPGGGPLDVWVTSRDLRGHVEFAGRDSQLHFPRVFGPPLALSRASGVIDWAYDGPRSFVSGRELEVDWNGARVEGGFGLSVGGGQRGGFGLQLDLHDVDAIETPLVDWLPVGVLGPELTDWLVDGVAGRVPEGSLRLHVPLSREGVKVEPVLQLALEVEEGRLSFAPGWPAIEGVGGRLRMADGTLTAEVDRAESLGVEARGGEVRLADERLEVSGGLEASAEALRRYLLALPVEGMAAVEDWQGEGRASGTLDLALTLGEPGSLELDIATEADFARLVHDPLELTFRDLQGPLAWHQRGEEGGLEGRLAGRLLGGPVSSDIDTLAGGLDLAGTAEAQAIAEWSGMSGLGGLIEGQLPWQGRLAIGDEGASLRLDSGLEGLAIALPDPLGKRREARLPLRLTFDLTGGRLDGRLGDRLGLRWRELDDGASGQGQAWLGRQPDAWPRGPGWRVEAYQPRLPVADWARALSPLVARGGRGQGDNAAPAVLSSLVFETDCLQVQSRCLGSLVVEGGARSGGWELDLAGSLATGHLSYRPALEAPLDIVLERLSLDALVPPDSGSGQLLDELDVPPEATPLPEGLEAVPDGRLRVAEIAWQGQRLGPFNGRWRSAADRLVVDPLGLTLGEISAHGNLVWEASGAGDSLTRARLDLDGRDLGTALAVLGQPVAVRSAETRVTSQLAWPGAPWQFALARSRGSLEMALRDGRFVNIESPSARVVGLLNVDNLLRRLRLDFSDVTGQGTAFDRVTGAATLYGGVLETRGPVEIEGPATRFTLDGSVDLARRELDQRLAVTVPVSSNLPLAAVLAGAPVVGGALFLADKLFGEAIDRVTRIHYRVQGPWTSPRISLESAE